MLAFIPSPSSGALHLGPLQLRAYGLCIALGVWAAVVVTARRYRARGGDGELITAIALWAVPAGIIGARIYHVITDYELYFSRGQDPWNAFKIWDGGLGIWGGILLGVVVGAYVGHRHGADIRLLFDATAPALPLAQAVGRWGNWWNQELYGKPTGLPWGLEINAAHRVAAYAQYKTFQPTFLYESIWDLCVVGIVLLVGRRFHLRKGSLLGVYVAAYTFGRFFTEYERIDFAHKIGPLRLNDWTSVVVFAAAVAVLVVYNRPGAPSDEPAAGTAADADDTPGETGEHGAADSDTDPGAERIADRGADEDVGGTDGGRRDADAVTPSPSGTDGA